MNKKILTSSADFNPDVKNVFSSERGFCDLPDEILLEIFKNFSFCEMRKYATVCKRWHNLSWRACLLYNVNIKRKNIPINILENIFRSGVKKLNIKSCVMRIPDDGICFEGARFDTVQAICIDVIQKCRPFQTFLEYILRSCLNLQELRLFIIWLDESVFRTIMDMKSLQILDIQHNAFKSSSNISKYVSKSPKFGGLSFLCICIDCISDIKFSMMETLIMSAPDLRFLIISNSFDKNICTLVSPTFFKQLSMLKHLEVLQLPWMRFTSTSAVLDTLKSLEWRTSFENLKKLSLDAIEDDLGSLFPSRLQLRQAFVVNFLKPCLNIETLALAWLQFNNELILQLSQMKKLKELKISDTFSEDFFITSPTAFEGTIELGVTTLKIKFLIPLYCSFMLRLLTFCPKLESLYFRECEISEASFVHILGIRSLQKLNLKNMLGECWKIAFSVFKNRKIIDFSKVPGYTEEIEILLQEQAEIKSE